MAILDTLTQFEDGVTTFVGAAGSQVAGDVVDLGLAGRDIGNGQPVYATIFITAAPTGADTVKFEIVSDSTDPQSADGTESVHAATGDIAIADLPAGTKLVLPLAVEGVAYERYLGVNITNVGVGALASLQFVCGLTLDPTGWKAYADALPAFPA
jgi:hypothetical protein